MKKYQIKKINGHQTSKIISIVLGIIFLIPLTFSLIISLSFGQAPIGEFFIFLLFPLFYFLMIYSFTRLFIFVYNKLVSKFGGIEIQLELEE